MKRNLLYVDDERENHVVFKVAFGDHFNILEAASAREALDFFESQEIPVMVADQRMPDVTGVELCAAVRRSFPQTIRMLLTGYTDPDAMMAAINEGQVYSFITKPWDREMLFSMLVRGYEAYDLTVANANLIAADHAKNAFLAHISHEIRTPMTAILGYAECLREEGNMRLAPAERVAALDTILRNGQHLLQIINDILDISRIEAGKLEIERVPCSLGQVLEDVESLVRPRAREKGLTLKLERVGELPAEIRTDPTRLTQILTNLVGNAIKFTDRGGVCLSTEVAADAQHEADAPNRRLRFTVEDTGIGMSPQQISTIFKPFTQGDDTMTRRYSGTGLGLALSKRLSEMLAGDISVESTPGKGSAFVLTIPAGSLDAAEPSESPPRAHLIPAPPSEAPPRPARMKGRILLAEDGPDNRALISLVLRRAGLRVRIAANGQIACDLARKADQEGMPFDLILMDMEMPVLDGYTATRLLRAEGYKRPIVALTAHAMSGHRRKCLEAGCDDFVAKPVDRARLLSLVERHVGSESAAAERRAGIGAATDAPHGRLDDSETSGVPE